MELVATQQIYGKSYGPVAAGGKFRCPPKEASMLIAKGRAVLPKYAAKIPDVRMPRAHPTAAVGAAQTSSASPAAQASPKSKSKKSAGGASRKRKKAEPNDE